MRSNLAGRREPAYTLEVATTPRLSEQAMDQHNALVSLVWNSLILDSLLCRKLTRFSQTTYTWQN